jgi:hypothetical protein
MDKFAGKLVPENPAQSIAFVLLTGAKMAGDSPGLFAFCLGLSFNESARFFASRWLFGFAFHAITPVIKLL